MTTVGENIRSRRLALRMTQEELAAKLYTTRQTVSNYEQGRSEPDLETLKLLAEQLDTDAETLLYGPEKNAERNAGAAQKQLR